MFKTSENFSIFRANKLKAKGSVIGTLDVFTSNLITAPFVKTELFRIMLPFVKVFLNDLILS